MLESFRKAFKAGTITAFLVESPNNFTVNTLSKGQNLGIIEVSLLCSGKKSTTLILIFDMEVDLVQDINYIKER
jgi:hypothetical protein